MSSICKVKINHFDRILKFKLKIYIYRFEIKLKIEKVKHKINVVLNQMKDYNENNFLTRMIAMTVTTV